MGRPEMIALDTHFWVWFHTGDERLSKTVLQAIGRDTILSAASIWEVMLLMEKGRIQSEMTPEETVRQWLGAAPMTVVPIDKEIAVLSRTLAFSHDDLADRFIAATAHRAKAPLATIDARLSSLRWLKTMH